MLHYLHLMYNHHLHLLGNQVDHCFVRIFSSCILCFSICKNSILKNNLKSMIYLIIIIWVVLDLFTKNLAFNSLQEKVNVLWDFLYLQYFENTGIAFSTQIPGLKYLTIFLILAIFYYYFVEKKSINLPLKSKGVPEGGGIWNLVLLDWSFWLILAWAIWNWIERVFNWYVIDFIWVKYFSVFNLADSFITIWAILYLYLMMFPLSLRLKGKNSR